MYRFSYRVSAFSLAALFVLSGVGLPAVADAPAPLIIGAVISYTGVSAPLGIPQKNALELAEKQIDAHGGIGGRPVHFDIQDDEAKPDIAAEIATSMVGKGYAAIICGTRVATGKAVARVTESAGVLTLYLTPNPDVWQTSHGVVKTIFALTQRNIVEVHVLTDFARSQLHAKSFGIIHDENEYGTSGAAQVADTLQGEGASVVANESYRGDSTDFTAQIQHLKDAKPDAIILWGATTTPGLLTRQMRTLGENAPLLGSTGIGSDGYLRVAGPAANGVYSDETFNGHSPDAVQKPFVDAYRAAYGIAPVYFAAAAYDAAEEIFRAMASTKGKTDGASLGAALETLPPYHGTCGIYRLSATDHSGLSASDSHVVVVRNGAFANL